MGQKTKGGNAKAKPPAPQSTTPGGDVKREAQVVEKEGPSSDDLIALLDRHVRANDYKQTVKVADQILALEPGDVEALECKVVALIQSGDTSQALQTIDSTQKPNVDLNFHKAYCLYRLNQPTEALAALKGVERSASVLQLEAQILYRMGNFRDCIPSCEKLFRLPKFDSIEVKTNLVAAYVAGGRSSEVPSLLESLKVTPRSGFELAHNAACGLVERQEFSKAEELLLVAQKRGEEILYDEEYTVEEIEGELAPISVQLAFVHQMQGRTEEAIVGYNKLLKSKLADKPSLAVASNNLIAMRGARDLFDSLKKSDKLLEKKQGGQKLQFVEGLEHKLSPRQKEAICYNRCLLLLHSSKLDQAREYVSSLVETFPDSVVPRIFSASLLLKEGKHAHADDLLVQYAKTHPNDATEAHLVRAQAAAAAGNYLQAADALEMITELRHKPGMVATIVALKEKGGDIQAADAVLEEAVEHWDNYMGDDDTGFVECGLQEAAAFKLRHNKMQEAATILKRLVNSSATMVRTEALTGLVCCTAYSDPVNAELYVKQLPPLPGLSSVKVEALERAAPSTLGSKRGRGAEEGVKGNKTGDDKIEEVKAKKIRKRKPLYPKGFDPANPGPPPDPERWLPKRERSSYRPKKKDKLKAQIRGSQGSVLREKSGDPSATDTNGPSTVTASNSRASSKTTNLRATSEAPKLPPSTGSHKGKKKGHK